MPRSTARVTRTRLVGGVKDWLQDLLLRSVVETLTEHDQRLNALEATVATLNEVIADIDAATNDLATELDALRGRIAAGDATAAEQLAPVAARLRALAADPTNPVPEPTPDQGV